jgi:hypothetical protein
MERPLERTQTSVAALRALLTAEAAGLTAAGPYGGLFHGDFFELD